MMRLIAVLSLLASSEASMDDFLNDPSLRAHDDSLPYIVRVEKTILRKSATNNQCTGMVVSSEWVTSSCVCLLQMNKEDKLFTWPPAILFRLTAGATNKNSRLAQIRFAIKIRYHPLCNLELKTMDVALMKANYPFSKDSFLEGTLVPFPVASEQIEFIEAGLDTFIRRRLTCGVYGWPSIPGQRTEFLLELNVMLVKDDECGEIACKYAPGLCDDTRASGYINYAEDSKGDGFVCARVVNSLPPCVGFEGAPLVCGTNVWATVTAMDPCNETIAKDTILMTRLDVQYQFLTSNSAKSSSSGGVSLFWVVVTLKLKI